jgi:hypothetical protein
MAFSIAKIPNSAIHYINSTKEKNVKVEILKILLS